MNEEFEKYLSKLLKLYIILVILMIPFSIFYASTIILVSEKFFTFNVYLTTVAIAVSLCILNCELSNNKYAKEKYFSLAAFQFGILTVLLILSLFLFPILSQITNKYVNIALIYFFAIILLSGLYLIVMGMKNMTHALFQMRKAIR